MPGGATCAPHVPRRQDDGEVSERCRRFFCAANPAEQEPAGETLVYIEAKPNSPQTTAFRRIVSEAVERPPLGLVFDNKMEQTMAQSLSQQLADLSVRAKNAEDAIAAASREAHEKIEARKEEARNAATKATEKVKQEIESARDTATRNWSAVRAKIATDIDSLKAGVAHAKHEADVRHTEARADKLEWEARVAVDYAIASVEQARLAVLDAVSSRAQAEQAGAS